MRKIIAAMNMSRDGFCNHEDMIADDEIHQHYNELLSSADTLIYGRITYQLMESYWPSVVQHPTGNQPMYYWILRILPVEIENELPGMEWISPLT